MKIGELAKRSGCSIQTIRYYEKEGLISAPARTDGNFRVYDTPALEK
ncbi:MerR family DNA-binding transcriptional regulator, partial [Alcanivorax sp. VBW004]